MVVAITANFSNHNFAAAPGSKEDRANANLIASAPDLYEALNRVHDIINSYAGISAIKEACFIIQKALKKADGES